MVKYEAEVLVCGASVGGVAAALALLERGREVVLTEACPWIGGQLSSQAVPPDEHRWIEDFGCTASYRRYRERVRAWYRNNRPLTPSALAEACLDPGASSVSRLSHEPAVADAILRETLAPYIRSAKLRLIEGARPVAVTLAAGHDDRVESVEFELSDGSRASVLADFFIDATDQGELSPMARAEWTGGAESRAETGEPDAPLRADPDDLQPVTWVAAMSHEPGVDNRIEEPAAYRRFRALAMDYDRHLTFSWYGPDSSTGRAKRFGMFDGEGQGLFPLWTYRRILWPGHYRGDSGYEEITLLNWPQNDYYLGNLYGEGAAGHWAGAREFTMSFFYWLQTEAPRPDGGCGYPGLRLRPDATGTADGLAQHPYVRESRRMRTAARLLEQDVAEGLREGPVRFVDSVGVGCYHVDLHITTGSRRFMFKRVWPFELPMGMLVPVRMKNLLPACKNVGTTHLTNGCCRLHPVEWNLGESAGNLAASCLDERAEPQAVYRDRAMRGRYLDALDGAGVERSWPADEICLV